MSNPSSVDQPVYRESEASRDDKIFRALVIIVSVLLVCVLALGAYYLATRNSDDQSSASPQFEQPSAQPESSSASAPEEKTDEGRPATPELPNAATPVNQAALNSEPAGNFNNVYLSGPTTAPFALAVRDAFVDHFLETKETSGVIQAYSPMTRITYTMNCEDKKSYVHCTGGNNANVYIA